MPFIHWETQKKQACIETFILCKFLLEVKQDRLPKLVQDLFSDNPDLIKDTSKKPSHDERLSKVQSALQSYVKCVNSGDKRNDLETQATKLLDVLRAYQQNFEDDCDAQLINEYCKSLHEIDYHHGLHIRRTLDQSYYYMLNSTAWRNRRQVVSQYSKSVARKDPVVMMVDQLWLWIINGKCQIYYILQYA